MEPQCTIRWYTECDRWYVWHERQCTIHKVTTNTHTGHGNAQCWRSFNCISKVLFAYPSWYICATDFGHVFMFRWLAPPVYIQLQTSVTRAIYTVVNCAQIPKGQLPSLEQCYNHVKSAAMLIILCTTHHWHRHGSIVDDRLVHSQWLKVLCLLLIPPRINMLKFRWLPNTISWRIRQYATCVHIELHEFIIGHRKCGAVRQLNRYATIRLNY